MYHADLISGTPNESLSGSKGCRLLQDAPGIGKNHFSGAFQDMSDFGRFSRLPCSGGQDPQGDTHGSRSTFRKWTSFISRVAALDSRGNGCEVNGETTWTTLKRRHQECGHLFINRYRASSRRHRHQQQEVPEPGCQSGINCSRAQVGTRRCENVSGDAPAEPPPRTVTTTCGILLEQYKGWAVRLC